MFEFLIALSIGLWIVSALFSSKSPVKQARQYKHRERVRVAAGVAAECSAFGAVFVKYGVVGLLLAIAIAASSGVLVIVAGVLAAYWKVKKLKTVPAPKQLREERKPKTCNPLHVERVKV